jgi:hypothetical protein
VGRVAFKRRATPLKGNHVFVLPLCIVSFHLSSPQMGAPVVLPPCHRWGNATSRKLVPFSHHLASRIFVRRPGCTPPPMGSLVEGSEPGCGLRPALSFKDFRHPG